MLTSTDPGAPLVLVVDDFAAGRRVTERMLTLDARYRVLVASTGQEALTLAETDRVAAILLDVELPDMSGWNVAEQLASVPATAQIPILIVTASDDERTRERCRLACCISVLVKPVPKDTLLENLQLAISGGRVSPTDSRRFLQTIARPVVGVSRRVTLVVDSTVADLVPGYLVNRRRDLIDLLDLLERREFVKIQRIGHNMKGSGASYGMPEISTIGGHLEAAGATRNEDEVLQLRAQLASYVESAALELELTP